MTPLITIGIALMINQVLQIILLTNIGKHIHRLDSLLTIQHFKESADVHNDKFNITSCIKDKGEIYWTAKSQNEIFSSND